MKDRKKSTVILIVVAVILTLLSNELAKIEEKEEIENIDEVSNNVIMDENFLNKYELISRDIDSIIGVNMEKKDLALEIKNLAGKFKERSENKEDIYQYEVEEDLARGIILAKYRNNSILNSPVFNLDSLYVDLFEDAFVVDLVEKYTNETSSLENVDFNIKVLEESKDNIIKSFRLEENEIAILDEYLRKHS